MITLEIAVDNFESAIRAAKNGAHRLELCSALSEGGLTPSVGFLKELKTELKNLGSNTLVFCMLRPRGGYDFQYTDREMAIIINDMELLQANGADGFVFGALNPDNSGINEEQCKRVIEQANGLPVTFHRAFDVTKEDSIPKTMEDAINVGFQRILTSGHETSAECGINEITELVEKYGDRIAIMPGGGITTENAENILRTTKCPEFHTSARPSAEKETSSVLNIDQTAYASGDIVKKLLCIAKNVSQKCNCRRPVAKK